MGLLNMLKASISYGNYASMRTREVENLERRYDFYSIEGVRSIPVPCRQVNDVGSITGAVEYYLRIRAGISWDEGKHDLAIECLRKSNQLLPHSHFLWQAKDYGRLVEYLKNAGRWDEARQEEARIKQFFNIKSLYATKKEAKARYEYDWLRQFSPSIAPKTFNAFMRMKNAKSENYKKIYKEAKRLGFTPLQ